MPKKHIFKNSLVFGKMIEKQIDEILSKWYEIEEVSLAEEKEKGIDRVFRRKSDNKVYLVEYKADRHSIKTNNIFVELEVSGKPGWTRKTQADIVLYAIVDSDIVSSILILTKEMLSSSLPTWELLPKKTIVNNGFNGTGVLVPISSLNVNIIKG